jgi:uncharacterized protein with PIN domain/sulfur carrier protein ThiS
MALFTEPAMEAVFRFYAELNCFLAPLQRGRGIRHACPRDASVKHMIEALGVPHTEAALILVDGTPVSFSHRLQEGDRISVYPAFMQFDIDSSLLRPPLAMPARFVADAHLGQLARNLRMLGFDVLYRNDYRDAEVAHIASEENRIVLTRDRDLLIRKEIVYGCYLHALDADSQAIEVLARFRLADAARAFSRCLSCNGVLLQAASDAVADRVPLHSRRHYSIFYECSGCEQVYWEGSHVERMRLRVARLLRK